MSSAGSSVTTWIQELCKGDKDLAAQNLWEHYFQRLVGLARSILGNRPRGPADEEDVALSAFESFCQGAQNGRFPLLEDRDNLWRLLVVITARKAQRLARYNSRQKRGGNGVLDEAALRERGGGDADLTLDQILAAEPTPEFAAEAADEYRRLLGRLEDQALRDLAQWKMEGYTNAEIAARLNCAPRTIERRLVLLRKIWSEDAEAST